MTQETPKSGCIGETHEFGDKSSVSWYLQKLTLIELLVLIAIVAVLGALLFAPAKWASSGNIRFPVRVIIFDAVHGKPIADAHVGIFRAAPIRDRKLLEEQPDEYSPAHRLRDEDTGTTGADGAVVINYEFRTGANHDRPTSHAHLSWAWVYVRAEGYGNVVTPVRYESEPTAILRAQKELLVTVGLIPTE